MSEHMNFDANKIGVFFIPGVFKVSVMQARVAEEVSRLGVSASSSLTRAPPFSRATMRTKTFRPSLTQR
jgi:hypothetical protein